MKVNNSESYQEIKVDNPFCTRRFHMHFDPTAINEHETVIKCPHCQATVISKKNHPKLYLDREENLVNAPQGSHKNMKECFLVNK